MRTQRFGIEIEVTGLTRKRAAEEVAKFFNTEATHRRLSLDEYHIMDGQNRSWKVVSDSSLRPQKKEKAATISDGVTTQTDIIVSADSTYEVEIVSPILTYADIGDLQEIVRLLRGAGAFVNKGCGIHYRK